MYRFFGPRKIVETQLKPKEFIKKFISVDLLDTKDLDIPYREAILILKDKKRTNSQNDIVAELVNYYFDQAKELKRTTNGTPVYQQLAKVYEQNAQDLHYRYLSATEGTEVADKYERNLLIKGKADIIDWSNSDNFIFHLQSLNYSDEDIEDMLAEYYTGSGNWSEILKFYEKKYGVNK